MNRHIAILVTSVIAAFAPITAATAATTKRYSATTQMKFGDVKVTIAVRGKRIVNVSSVLPTERPKSQRINEQAAVVFLWLTDRPSAFDPKKVDWKAGLHAQMFIQELTVK